MKKFSIAVCVCAVLFSFSNYGECVREVSAQTSGAEENLAILQDIIRENECQAGMAFLGYTYENADTSEILEYTRQEELAAAYPFLQDGTVVDAGGYEIYAIVPGLDCKISIYPTQVTEEGEYLEDLNNPWYMGQENEVIILRCAGADRKFVWAKAYIDGNKVVVFSEKVPNPVAVRYGWSNNPYDDNLVNSAGLLASPFRTDQWKGITEK